MNYFNLSPALAVILIIASKSLVVNKSSKNKSFAFDLMARTKLRFWVLVRLGNLTPQALVVTLATKFRKMFAPPLVDFSDCRFEGFVAATPPTGSPLSFRM